MDTETIPVQLHSQQIRSFSGWLSTNRIKRGALLYWATLFTLSAAIIHFVSLLKQLPQSGLLAVLLFGGTLIQAIIAITVFAISARHTLIAAATIEVVAMLLWFVAHISGFPIGATIWKMETISTLDLYIPVMECMSGFFFLCLAGRSWSTAPRIWRIAMAALPTIVIVGLVIWIVINLKRAQLFIAVFILSAGLPDSLLDLFLPLIGLLVLVLLLRIFIPRLRTMTPKAGRTTLTLFPALLIISLTTWAGSVNAINGAWFPSSATIHAPAGQTTLAYCNSSSGNPLAMDISEPSAQATRPAPVVFYIHGGEGLQGNRQLDGTDGVYFTQLRDMLVSRGFVVGSIDYGLLPFSGLFDEVKQAKCAVRFLRAHSSELGIDPNRVGVYGVSMGGYLSAMLGTAGPQAGLDVGQYQDQSSRVQAVVDMWGPTDLSDWSGSPSWVKDLGQGLSGGGPGSAARTKAFSPVSFVAHNDPPFLIIQGTDDWFIAPHHSQNMAKQLQAAGVPTTLVMVQHDGHGLAAPTAGQVEQPSPNTLIHMISDFFTRTLAA